MRERVSTVGGALGSGRGARSRARDITRKTAALVAVTLALATLVTGPVRPAEASAAPAGAAIVPMADAVPVVSDVAAGARHSCAIADNQVWCWGDNARGQLGNGTQLDAASPSRVKGLPNASSVTAGTNHTCAIVTGGDVLCWGANNLGQLGDGTTTDRLTPVKAQLPGPASSVDAGRAHTCAVVSPPGRARGVWCWGSNSHGQLGIGDISDVPFVPTCISLVADAACRAGLRARSLDVGPDGSLWVTSPGAQASQNRILRFDLDGRLLGSYGVADSPLLSDLYGPIAAGRYPDGYEAPRPDGSGGTPVVPLGGAPTVAFTAVDAAGNSNGFGILDDLSSPGSPRTVYATTKPFAFICPVTAIAATDPLPVNYSFALICPANIFPPRVVVSTGVGSSEVFESIGDLAATPQGSATTVRAIVRQPESGASNLLVTINDSSGAVGRKTTVPSELGSCVPDAEGSQTIAGIGAAGSGVVLATYTTDENDRVVWSCLETRAGDDSLLDSLGAAPDAGQGLPGLYSDVVGTADDDVIAYDALHGRVVKIRQDGTIDNLWGRTRFLSTPRETANPDPLLVPDVVSVGSDFSCMVDNIATQASQTQCWGDNGAGQIDDAAGAPAVVPSPQRIQPITARFAAGAHHTCFTGNGGAQATSVLRCRGELALLGGTGDLLELSSGSGYACAVGLSRGIGCTVLNGAWPPGSPFGISAPNGAALTEALNVDAGSSHACAVATGPSGRGAYCWGGNADKQVSPAADTSFAFAQFVSIVPTITVALTLTDRANGLITPVPQFGPLVVTSSRPLRGVSSPAVRLVATVGTNLPTTVTAALVCRDEASAVVDCMDGPAKYLEFTPARGLSGDALYSVQVNQGGLTSVEADGRSVTATQSNTVGALVSAPVALALGGPTGPSLPVRGPVSVTFDPPVKSVNDASLRLMASGADTRRIPARVVRCTNAAGTDVDCIAGPVSRAELALAQGKMFIPGQTYVVAANFERADTLPRADIVTGVGSPTALAVTDDAIYWVDAANGRIGRSGLDGQDVQPAFLTDIGRPVGIAVADGYVYWSTSAGAIGRASLDGSDVDESYATGLDTTGAIVADADYVYWAGNGRVGRVSASDPADLRPDWFVLSTTATPRLGPFGLSLDAGVVRFTFQPSSGVGVLIGSVSGDAPAMTTTGVWTFPFTTLISLRPTSLDTRGDRTVWAGRRPDSAGGALLLDGTVANTSIIGTALPDALDVAFGPQDIYWTDGAVIGSIPATGSGAIKRMDSAGSGASLPTQVSAARPVLAASATVAITADAQGRIPVDAPVLIRLGPSGLGNVTEQTVTLERADGSTVPTTLLGCSNGTAAVACSSTTVRRIDLRPEDPLLPGAAYRAVVNPDYSVADLLTVGGVIAARRFSSPATTPGCSIDCFTVTGGGATPTIALTGPIVVTPSAPVSRVSNDDFLLRQVPKPTDPPLEPGAEPSTVGVSAACRIGTTAVSCGTAGVTRIVLTPRSTLVAGRTYQLDINPPGSTAMTIEGLAVPPTSSGELNAVRTLTATSTGLDYRWGEVNRAASLGGRVLVERRAGAVTSFDFTGSRVRWTTVTGPGQGWATVRIDGAVVARVNTYSAVTTFGRTYTFTVAGEGRHRLTITVDGRKGSNAPGAGSAVAVDALASWVDGRLETVINPRPPGRWAQDGSSTRVSSIPRASMAVAFAGAGVSVRLERGAGQGVVDLFVDGNRMGRVDLGANGPVTTASIPITGLAPGAHRLELRVVRGRVAIVGLVIVRTAA